MHANKQGPWVGLVAVLALVPSGCGGTDETALAQSTPCRVAQRLVALPSVVPESSGAAMSQIQTDLIWTHNDSGGEPELYAVDPRGQLVATVVIRGATNVDWEDLAVSACESGTCIYVADIGDNEAERDDVAIYRIPEPAPGAGVSATAEVFPIEFPTGPQDAEALFVLPGEQIFLITKGGTGPIAVYRYPGPPRPRERVQLELVRQLSAGPVPLADRVTAADASTDGSRVAVRTRTSLLFYDAETFISGAEVSPLSVEIGSLGEAQGEGVGYGANGGIVLTSEAPATGASGTLGILWCP